VAKDQGGLILVNADTQEQELDLRVDTSNRVLAGVSACFELATRLVVLEHSKSDSSRITFVT
jgi:hypothetical protein